MIFDCSHFFWRGGCMSKSNENEWSFKYTLTTTTTNNNDDDDDEHHTIDNY